MMKCLDERVFPSAKVEETKRVDFLAIAPGQSERKRFIGCENPGLQSALLLVFRRRRAG